MARLALVFIFDTAVLTAFLTLGVIVCLPALVAAHALVQVVILQIINTEVVIIIVSVLLLEFRTVRSVQTVFGIHSVRFGSVFVS